jgi:hypothetical protein
VITNDDVSFGVARMYATLNEEADAGFVIFRSAAEAEAWVCGDQGGLPAAWS